MTFLIESAVKAGLIVLFALCLMPALRHRSAALRHWVLAAALVCAALVPFARVAIPSWELPIASVSTRDFRPGIDERNAIKASLAIDRSSPAETTGLVRPVQRLAGLVARAFPAIWIAGAGLVIGTLLVGFTRLAWLASEAKPITTGLWAERAAEIGCEYGLRRPVRLLHSRHPGLLVTWGVLRPSILLPAPATRWRDDRVSLVLYHELAHVRRSDWIVQLVAELLRAVYWFVPFMWIACSRLRQESEQACDDEVLSRGREGTTYAAHLLGIARELQRSRVRVPAPSIARPSSLERRITAMLDHQLNRRPLSRSACAATLAALLSVAVPVAGIAVAQVFATVGGSIVDPMNGVLPDVTLLLTTTRGDAKYEVRSDRNGRYQFVGVPEGDYRLEARLPGFATFHGTLTVAGQSMQRDLKLQVGTLQETITVRDKYVPGQPAYRSAPSDRRGPRAAPTCSAAESPAGTPVGGDIRPPVKLLDVRPDYPATALSAGVEGTVVLKARIGTDGYIDEVAVVSTPDPALATAAVDAVRQWEFDPTYLNCVAIPVDMKVTVNFDFAR